MVFLITQELPLFSCFNVEPYIPMLSVNFHFYDLIKELV
jgi:hypothetical protein